MLNWQGAAEEPVRTARYLGVDIAMIDARQAAELVAARPASAPFTYVVTPNAAHFTRLIRLKDARFRAAYDDAGMRLLDGQMPRFLARLLFSLDIPHAAGSDVTLLLLQHHLDAKDGVTVIGGSEAMIERLRQRFGLRRLAHLNPSMGFIEHPHEVAKCVDFIVEHSSRYVFFVVGSPQSEYLAHMVRRRGGAVGCGLCVGSALNFASGEVARAPDVLRKTGMEWAYRLARNPFGHARRVFVDSMPIFRIALEARFGLGNFRERKHHDDRV